MRFSRTQPNRNMRFSWSSSPSEENDTSEEFDYIVTHVFCPMRLPDGDDHTYANDQALIRAVSEAVQAYAQVITDAGESPWPAIIRMLDNFLATVQSARLDKGRVIAQFNEMCAGDVLAFFVRAQNAGVLFKRETDEKDITVYAAFEASPKASSVITTKGKLICSYPGPAIEVPNAVFGDAVFRAELANFLVCMNEDDLDDRGNFEVGAAGIKRGETVTPRYITELLTGILRGVGCPATSVTRVTKRVGDDVISGGDPRPWRRSPLWLVIRIAIQTTLESSPQGHEAYKHFMVFLLARLAEEAIRENLSSDLLYFMSTKISRRLKKLGPLAPGWLAEAALATCSHLRGVLDMRWEEIQAVRRTSPPHKFSNLNVSKDVQLSLECSREYLAKCLLNKDAVPPAPFHPKHRPRGTLDDFLSRDGTFFADAFRAEPHVTLYDVELAVEQGIDTWLDGITDVDQACIKLEILIDKYSSAARKIYENPEQLSVMLVTTIELWVALDKLAVGEILLLGEYSPEIPAIILESLLLCKHTSLRRQQEALQYITSRCSRSESKFTVFSPDVSEDTFAVRYYRQSPDLHDLKRKIEEAAQQEVDKKVEELKKANQHHAKLSRKADGMCHTCHNTDDDSDTPYHASDCTKCDLELRLNKMDIDVYEWPLPDDDLQAAVVIFELALPMAFSIWRTATFRFLIGLCSQRPGAKAPFLLKDYSGLQKYFRAPGRSRIMLASNSGPSGHASVSIPATEDQMRGRNSLASLFGFDTQANIPVANAFSGINVRQYCTYVLQDSPYSNLQHYVDSTTHTSNDVLAHQYDCDKDLSIHEFVAFGHLRCGSMLQWLNVLRELRDRSLTFRSADVHFLVAQATKQAGPFSGTKLKWHEELQKSSFGHVLVGELESLAADVEGNWLEGVTMNTISLLLGRLLASGPSKALSERAVEVLRAVRAKTFSWVRELSDKLTRTPGDEELRGLLRDIAAICRSTFDAEPLEELLYYAEDVETLLACAILIHDNTPTKVSSLPVYSQLLLDRDRRLSLVLEGFLNHAIDDEGCQGIDAAVGMVWPDYRPGSEWTSLPCPNSRWLSCTTASTTIQCSQVVQFNLLDGSLLVDGKPLGRLPHAIVQHPLYIHIFGEDVVDVIPGDLPGMDYSTRGTISGHQVYFSLCNRDRDLVIRARRTVPHGSGSEIFHLIPQEKLENDFPAVLIQDHVHWLNLNTSVMEIRASDKPWQSLSDNWTVDCTPGQYRMRKGRELLVDVRSKSWTMVSDLLSPLESPQNLIITVPAIHPGGQLQLSVSLPRYGLSFFVDEDGDLQSRNIRDMVYDENQSIGTLFGLVNQLVLRPKVRDDVDARELIPRCVLVPEGNITFQLDEHHVRVEINTNAPTLQRVTYQMYRVDPDLGGLTGNISLTNKLYLAYLHALTSSGCSVDPLTERSGTEEALSLLRSATCKSIMKFGPRDAELLQSIASLCPKRAQQSRSENMQTVHWLNLPVRSQNHHLYLAAREIKRHVEKLRFFHDSWGADLFKKFPSHDGILFTRSLLRASLLLPSEGSEQRMDCDVVYQSRDVVPSDSAEHRVYTAASTIFNWSLDTSAITTTNANIVYLAASWTNTLRSDLSLSFTYHRSWLDPDFSSVWIKAYNLLRESRKSDDLFKILFSLPCTAYGSKKSDIVPVLLAFALHPGFCEEDPPPHLEYKLFNGYKPAADDISSCVDDAAHDFNDSPECFIPGKPYESPQVLGRRRHKAYRTRLTRDASSLVGQVTAAWPSRTPPEVTLSSDAYYTEYLEASIESLFQSCSRNIQFREHLTCVQNILHSLNARLQVQSTVQAYKFSPSVTIRFRTPSSVTLDRLIFTRPPPLLQSRVQLPSSSFMAAETSHSPSGFHRLQRLITTIQGELKDVFHFQYGSNLHSSASCFREEAPWTLASHIAIKQPSVKVLTSHHALCKKSFAKSLARVLDALGPTSKSDQALEQSGQWPRITTDTLFRSIASTSPIKLTGAWKKYLVQLALLLLEFQRARRLLLFAVNGQQEDFYKELENGGCDGWDPEAQPDWVLIQLQGDFFIRRVQVDVANEMVSPHSGENTAMQLNMGEGKSSVILPISVAKLADGSQLVRVVVPKALTVQMFQILIDRLGGLTNRPIYYLPFSRSLPHGLEHVGVLQSLMSECMRNRGILLVQPDHVLSLKLVTIEKQLSTDEKIAEQLLELQKWIHSFTRDILDESDEVLHSRYQLVYTVGLQQHIEGFPERWTTTQQVLQAVKKHVAPLRAGFMEGIDYQEGPPGTFPYIRILHPDTAEALISQIARDAVNGHLPNIHFQQLGSQVREALLCFITGRDVSAPTLKIVEEYARQTTIWENLLLIRGLLALDILLFAFRDQRWRVDYGLAPQRTMLAVPYRAKDVPAPKAEFGHPDVAIVLTCLSYYYGGLTEAQLRLSFELLLKQDDPSLDYDLWVRDCPTVPNMLRSYTGINLKSSEQWKTLLVPLFSRNHATVDFFLAGVVFPKEAKEFPSKLACSGWDLAEKKERLLTGFSGTNDGRYLLPLHITQRDPDHQRGTNAKVLSYILQPENDHYMCTTHENGERRTTIEFLEILVAQQPEIRVLLDVGAQMLDLQNHKLAEAWLSVCANASAAIYFNEDDELAVLARDGSTQLLLSSPFARQLDQCVVYLDDAHTRGTDIKFPSGFRAAVTLGPKVTKDRLAQGCMRMRKLGHRHSLMFYAPLEVDRRIRTLANKGPLDVVDTMDILHWAIRETCDDIQHRAPHWAQQGTNHQARYGAWSKFCADQLTAEDLSNEWLQPEVKTLEELYAPQESSKITKITVPAIRERCISLGIIKLREGGMDEEQEREVIHEVEREREVERPVGASSAMHSLSKGVTEFVKTGAIPDQSTTFRPIFTTLDDTSAVTKEPNVWTPQILATADFCRTVEPPKSRRSSKMDNFLRPVHWIVSSKTAGNPLLVIFSPHEVDRLLPQIRKSQNVHLHVYTPRTTKSMPPTDDLSLYNIPAVSHDWSPPLALMSQLNVFAGQLYLSDYAAYIQMCQFFCVYAPDLRDEEDMVTEYDGFIPPEFRHGSPRQPGPSAFQSTPLPFVKVLLGLRRKGMSFGQTHMGHILSGRLLAERDFESIEDDLESDEMDVD